MSPPVQSIPERTVILVTSQRNPAPTRFVACERRSTSRPGTSHTDSLCSATHETLTPHEQHAEHGIRGLVRPCARLAARAGLPGRCFPPAVPARRGGRRQSAQSNAAPERWPSFGCNRVDRDECLRPHCHRRACEELADPDSPRTGSTLVAARTTRDSIVRRCPLAPLSLADESAVIRRTARSILWMTSPNPRNGSGAPRGSPG